VLIFYSIIKSNLVIILSKERWSRYWIILKDTARTTFIEKMTTSTEQVLILLLNLRILFLKTTIMVVNFWSKNIKLQKDYIDISTKEIFYSKSFKKVFILIKKAGTPLYQKMSPYTLEISSKTKTSKKYLNPSQESEESLFISAIPSINILLTISMKIRLKCWSIIWQFIKRIRVNYNFWIKIFYKLNLLKLIF
jgi:hypothetical protein